MAKLAAKIAARRQMRVEPGRGPFILPRALGGFPGITRYNGPMMYSKMDYKQAGDFLGIGKAVKKILGGTIGKVLKVIPGVGQVVGMIETGASVLAGSGKSKKSKTAGPSGVPLGSSSSMIPSLPMLQNQLVGGGFGMMPGGGMGLPTDAGVPVATAGGGVGFFGGGKPPAGYRYNKSRYYINDPLIPGSEQGREIEPGSRIVKIRHRNPFNPRAASRAMSRLSALHHGMKALERNLRKLAPPARHRAPARKR